MSFSAQISKYGKNTSSRISKIRRGVMLKLFSAVVMDTPVDTGRLRGNWLISQGAPNRNPVDRDDKSGQETMQEIQKEVLTTTGDESVFLTNNLPYAYRVEFEGWSHTKAPKGMVRRNVVRFNKLMKA